MLSITQIWSFSYNVSLDSIHNPDPLDQAQVAPLDIWKIVENHSIHSRSYVADSNFMVNDEIVQNTAHVYELGHTWNV